MKSTLVLCRILLLIAALSACRKNKTESYSITGRITDGDSGEGLSGVEVNVEKQVIENGIFGQTWINASSTTSDQNGRYECRWPRENFAALQVLTEKTNYIGIAKPLDVDAFKSADDHTIVTDLMMYKEGFISVNLRNTGMMNVQDRMAFTFLNADFDCNCCSNFWRVYEGASVDTTFTCRVYGNRWLKYQVQSTVGFSDSIFVDSIYCPAFATTALQIDY